MSAEYKERMRDLILSKGEYTEEEWRAIEDYNKDDVLCDIPLLQALAPTLDVPAALFRGRYLKAVAAMELRGLPVDTGYLHELDANWHALRMHYIERDDDLDMYRSDGSFDESRLAALIEARGWVTWPRTATGKPELRGRTLGKMAKRYPELKLLQRLRDQIAELRLGAFLNTIGADGHSRCPLMPFWTRSGRNQPQARDKVFLPSLPSWTHGALRPPSGWGLGGLDWSTQEPGIAAGQSGDPALIADYQSGDLHMRFAIRAGLAPAWATKASHGALREAVKPISIGINYGMTKYGAAAAAGRSLQWAADSLAAYRHAYPTFIQRQHDVVTQALFDQRIVSPLGWPMTVHADTKRRTLLNFPAQAGGADMMRLAAIAAHEAGIHLCAPVHDAFWIAAPLSELDDAIGTMTEIMAKAGRAIAGIDIPVELAAVVRWPQCLGHVRAPDAKGQAMWTEIKTLIRSGALHRIRDRDAAHA
jgi:DNA polymerase I